MPIPQALVTRYFQLLVGKQYAEAERELERVKQKLQKTEWNRGYFRALYGMYLSRKNANDSYAFFSTLDFSDTVALHAYRREFLDNMRSGLHGDFDRGYFSAWADCMRILTRMNISAPVNTAGSKTEDDEVVVETVLRDKSQATISNYLPSDKSAKTKKKELPSSELTVETTTAVVEDVVEKE